MPVLDPIKYRGEPPRANILRQQKIERRRQAERKKELEAAAEKAQQEVAEFEATHQKPGAGDTWITKADYNKLGLRLQRVYDKEGYEALVKASLSPKLQAAYEKGGWAAVVEASQPRSFGGEGTQTYKFPVDDDTKNAWKKYVKEGENEPSYKIAERMIAEGASDAEVYAFIQHHPTALRGAFVHRLVTKINNELDKMSGMTDREQFEHMIKLGFIPKGSKFVPGITQEEIARIKKGDIQPEDAQAVATMKPTRWSYRTLEQMKQAEQQALAGAAFRRVMRPYQSGAGYNLVAAIQGGVRPAKLKEFGFDEADIKQAQKMIADVKVREKYQAKIADYIKSDGSLDLVKLAEAAAKGKKVTAYQLRMAGYDISNKDYQKLLAGLTPQKALGELKGYEVISGPPGRESTGYDIARYLRDNPEGEASLRTAGFSNNDIREAQQYNKNNPWVYETAEERLDAYLKENNIYEAPGLDKFYLNTGNGKYEFVSFKNLDRVKDKYPELMELLKATQDKPDKYRKPSVSIQQFTANFLASRGIREVSYLEPSKGGQGTDWERYQTARAHAAEEYARLYGLGAMQQSGIVGVATFVFPPVRALQPEYKLSDVTAIEWGLGAANIVLIASPAITAPLKGLGAVSVTRAGVPILGKTTGYMAANAAIQAGAGAIYTTHTVQNWGKMSVLDRVISVIIDSALIGAALHSTVGTIKSVRAPKQAAFRFDFSTKASTVTSNANVGKALDIIQDAIAKQDIKLLRAGARQLELAGAEVPKTLGGDTIISQARNILRNPENYINLAKNPPSGLDARIVKSGLSANQKHLDMLIRQLRRTKNPDRIAAIKEAIKQTRKQIAVQTKTQIPPLRIRELTEPVPRKYSLIPVEEAKKALLKSDKKITVEKRSIPIKEFTEYSAAQVAKKYGVSSSAIVIAISNLPIRTKILIAAVHPDLPLTQPAPSPSTTVQQEAFIVAQPETQPTPSIEPSPVSAPEATTETTVSPETSPEPDPSPEPSPSPMPVPTMTTETTPSTAEPPKKKPYIRRQLDVEGRREDWGEVPEGTVVWKQGFGYWQVRPPYGRSDKHFTIRKPEGARIQPDMKTAAATLQTLSGKPPEYFGFSMGVVDVAVKSPPRSPDIQAAKASLSFTPSPKYRPQRRFGPYRVVKGGNTLGLKRRR